MSDELIPAYIGRKSCGCAVFVMVDGPDTKNDKAYQKDLSHELARCIRNGLVIERSTVGVARKSMTICKCKKVPNVQ